MQLWTLLLAATTALAIPFKPTIGFDTPRKPIVLPSLSAPFFPPQQSQGVKKASTTTTRTLPHGLRNVTTPVPKRKKHAHFSASCTDIQLDYPLNAKGRNPNPSVPSLLTAKCYNTNHTAALPSSLDLNECLGINYTTASLAWSELGKFNEYCSACSPGAAGVTLDCTCSKTPMGSTSGNRNKSGNSTTTGIFAAMSSIDLDEGIANQDGVLACGGRIIGPPDFVWGGV